MKITLTVVERKLYITAGLSLEDIKTVEANDSEKTLIRDEEGNTKFAVCTGTNASVKANGVVFNSAVFGTGEAQTSIDVSDCQTPEEVKAKFLDAIGVEGLENLKTICNNIVTRAAEIRTLRTTTLAGLTVTGIGTTNPTEPVVVEA